MEFSVELKTHLKKKNFFLASDGVAVNKDLKYGLIKLCRDEMPWIRFV